MYKLNTQQIHHVAGGLSEKQEESLIGKTGAYAANSVLMLSLFGLGFVSAPSLVITGLLAPTAKILGTYYFYEHKDWIIEQMGDWYPL